MASGASQSWRWAAPPLTQRRLPFAQVKVIKGTKVELAVRTREFSTSARSATYHYFTKSWLSHVLADKAALYTKEVKDIAGAFLSARRGGRLPSRVARRSLSGPG